MTAPRIRLVLCLALMLLGSAVLVGWAADIPSLTSVLPGLSTMKVNTAISFAVAGAGLLAAGVQRRFARGLAAACSFWLAAVGSLTLLEYFTGADLGIDEMFVADTGTLTGSGFPGRMSPLTASAFVALGLCIALLAFGRRRRILTLGHALSAVAGFVAFLAAAGYTFGAEAFWGIGFYTFMAIHTALGLIVAVAAALMTRADEGWLSGFSDTPGARRLLLELLPISVLLPGAVGLLLLLGSGLGAYNAAFGFALFVPFMTMALVLLGFRVTASARDGELALRRSDAQLRLAFEELRTLNESLEEQVESRTREREAAVAQLHEVQKLETMGQLTGGVAHDFNNLLTPILGSLDMLSRREGLDDRSVRFIDSALQAAERAKTLVARLLAFARRQTLEPQSVDVSELLAGMLDLIRGSLGPTIRVMFDGAQGPCTARVDPNQLELAVLNLAVNARDAMPNGGMLTIGVSQERVEAGHPTRLREGEYVRVSIVDTGEGMDEATLARAIEPFFSTKGIGRGTGLGLSMVHGLSAQSGGALQMSSSPGVGTRADLWLPQAPQDARLGPGAGDQQPHPAGGPTTLLLVDDEPLVRESVAEALEDLGYEVVQASSGPEALSILRSGAHIAGVITDYLMPGMTGGELIVRLAEECPELPVLLVTGYAKAAEDVAETVPRVAKPFRQAELAQAVDAILGARTPAVTTAVGSEKQVKGV